MEREIMLFNRAVVSRAPRRAAPVNQASRVVCQSLEQRMMLTVLFNANPYTTPANRADVPLTMNTWTPIEPFVRVNPTDPANVVPSSHALARVSTNGGATFGGTLGFIVPPGFTNQGGDTGMAFDAVGRLYWMNIAGSGTTGISVSRINPTTGASITSTNVSNGPNDDKGFIAADATATSPFANNVYVVWTRFAATTDVWFSRSINQGVSFSAPIQLSNSAVEGFVWPATVGVGPNGDVYVAYHANGSGGTVGRT